MPKVALYNVQGSQVGEIELNDAVFGIEPNESVVHEAVVMQMASWRQGTHCTKSRGEVRGGGRKPWKQKGTGRARVGTIRYHYGVVVPLYLARNPEAIVIPFLRKRDVLL